MPKPNYGFEKRQKEIAKQKKKEEKRSKKERASHGIEVDAGDSMQSDIEAGGQGANSTVESQATADEESPAEGGES